MQFWLRHQELFKGLQTKKNDPSIRIKHFSPAAMDRDDMEIAAPLEAAMKPSATSMEFWTQKKPEVDIADDPMPEFDVGNLEDLDTYTMSFMSQESKMEPRSDHLTILLDVQDEVHQSNPWHGLTDVLSCFIFDLSKPTGCYSVLDGSTHNQRSVQLGGLLNKYPAISPSLTHHGKGSNQSSPT